MLTRAKKKIVFCFLFSYLKFELVKWGKSIGFSMIDQDSSVYSVFDRRSLTWETCSVLLLIIIGIYFVLCCEKY